MANILIISSNIHKELSSRQLAKCLELVNKSEHSVEVKILEAGIYEIPYAINAYHQKNPFDGYIALGLALKTNADHYDYIFSHIKNCFSHFALNNIIVGNGIISGSSIEELSTKIDSHDPCLCAYPSAINAVLCLLGLNARLDSNKNI